MALVCLLNEGLTLNDSAPTLLVAAWRYRWLVLIVTGFVLAVGLLVQLLRPQIDIFEAEATVVVQEPATTDELGGRQNTSVQFIRAQVEIMNSLVVAEEASEMLRNDGIDLPAGEVLGSFTTLSSDQGPLVSITARHSDSATAVAIANGIAEGYRQVSQRQATATASSQVSRLDAQIDAIDSRLSAIRQERQALQEADPALDEIESQAKEAVGLIAQLQTELLDADPEEAEPIRQQIEDLRNRIAVFDQVIASPIGPEIRALDEEENGQAARRAQLVALRDQVAIDAELAPDAVALVQQANTAEQRESSGLSRVLAASLLLGLGLGCALAYFLAASRRSFSQRNEPESVLEVPLLADVPGFDSENLESMVPVWDHSRSAAAEAFRFAASTIERVARSRKVKSVFTVSSTLGQGKTTASVNAAVAAAMNGSSVLVMDCDFGNQEASRLLMGDRHREHVGMTDVLDGIVDIQTATQTVEINNGTVVSLMTRGTRPGPAANALQSRGATDLFSALGKSYDLIFIDGPPLLQVAYASTLAELADGLVVVVEHGGSYSQLNDLKDRLELLGKPVLGYIYNRSPLRREMTASEGSMLDIIGDPFMVDSGSSRRDAGRT